MFDDAKLKIKRANKHIHDLQSDVAAFLDTDFYRLYVNEDTKTGDDLLNFEITKPLSEMVPLIIGDAVHNLRTSLDLMVCELVKGAGGNLRRAKFPVDQTREDVVRRIHDGPIKLAGRDIVDLIVDEIRPYPGERGNNPLCGLHELDNTDKHRLLIPVYAITSITIYGSEGQKQTLGLGHSFGQTTKMSINIVPQGFDDKNYGDPTFEIRFPKGEIPFNDEAVVPTLHQLSQLVTGIVQTFEQALLARTQGAAHTPPTAGSHPPTT